MANEYNSPPEGPGLSGEKATAAFEEYRRRMDAFAAQMGGGMPPPTGQPFPGPYPPGSPGGGMPPWPAMMPPPPFPGPAMPGYGGAPAGTTRSLFESIGNMIRLGVDALNAGLRGGLQIVEGTYGRGAYGFGPSRHHGFPDPYPGCGWRGYPGIHDCCCDPCYVHHGCNPSVHNCG